MGWNRMTGIGYVMALNTSEKMKHLSIAVLVFALAFLHLSAFAQDPANGIETQDADWAELFDGESLNGWSGMDELWSVEDGAITGSTTDDTKLKKNSFLIWDGEVSDFELQLKFRIVGGNSGIQFRSKDLGEHHVSGYQADIDSNKRYTGILYEEQGRGILVERGQKVLIDAVGNKSAQGETCDLEEFAKGVDEGEWCDYVIRAEGNHITQSINGFQTVDLIDEQAEKAAKSGILALQIHVGPAMKVQFKDIRLQKLGQ
ncbi:MAG: DUF1080 domain-containing protein [Pirellulaceae bacterium]